MSTPADWMQKLNSSFTLNDSKPTVVLDERHAPLVAVDVLKYLALVIICILNVLGNTSVCIVVAKDRRLRRAVRNLAIASLACADLMMVPFFLYNLAKISHRTLHDACVFFSSFLIMSLYISIFHLFILSVDTYVAVFYPLRYKVIVTRNRIACALVLVWVLPVLNVIILPLSIDAFQASKYRRRMFLCGYHLGPPPPPTKLYRIHSLATGTVCAALPFVLIMAAYARIAKAAWYQALRDRVDVAGNSNARMRGNIRRMKELKWAKTVGKCQSQ